MLNSLSVIERRRIIDFGIITTIFTIAIIITIAAFVIINITTTTITNIGGGGGIIIVVICIKVDVCRWWCQYTASSYIDQTW